MQFSKQTIDKLKNFAQINPAIWLDKGFDVKTVNAMGSIYGYMTLEDHIDASFGIYDLHAFLDLLAMLGPTAEIEYDDKANMIYMKNDHSKINFVTTTKASINNGNDVPNLKLPTPVLTFNIKADSLNQIMKIAKKTGVNAIAIESEDGMIKINGYQVAEIKRNLNDPKMFSFQVAPYDGENEFKFLLNMANMVIPLTEYTVDIHVLGVNLMANFKSESAKFGIALEVSSEHNFDA